MTAAREPRRVLLAAISLVVGCSFESHPSLGWNTRPAEGMSDAAAMSSADHEADASNIDAAPVVDAATREVSCPTGLYAGQFTCMLADVPFPSTLPIQFRLDQLYPELPEATANGPIATGIGGSILIANLIARLDCTTGVFHANLTDGLALLIPVPAAAPFTGTIDGQIDEAGTLAGTWRLESPEGSPFAVIGACEGTWTASR